MAAGARTVENFKGLCLTLPLLFTRTRSPRQMLKALDRVSNCTSGGFLDICGICKFLDCDLNLRLGPEWLQEEPRFTAIKMKVAGTSYGMVTIPGEAIQELGFQIRSDIIAAG